MENEKGYLSRAARREKALAIPENVWYNSHVTVAKVR
jgi:hypothetical protein